MCNNVKLDNIFHKYKNNEFLINYDGSSISYNDFWKSVEGFAKKLISAGCKEGDFLLIKIENCKEYLQIYVACMETGIIACPIDPDLPEDRYKVLLDEINPSFIIDDIEKIKTFKTKNFNATTSTSNNNYNKNFIMLYSSGTTGEPKGILHTTSSLIASAKSFSQLSGINKDSVIYHHFPMYYMAGIFNMFLCPMVSGAKIVLGKRFSREQMLKFWDIPKKNGVNNLTLTPTMAISLVKVYRHDSSIMKYIQGIESIISTGSYLHRSTFDEFKKEFSIPLQTCYGVTEVGGTITFNSKEESELSIDDSVGSFDKKIDFKCEGTKHNPAEIVVRTPFMMSGYFINGKIKSGLKNGYFYTGDIGYLENNRLYITGRQSDRIKKGGEFISLSYIENTLMKFDLTDELCVLSIEDSFWGNKVLVFYVANNSYSDDSLKRELVNFSLKNLTKIEMPDEYIKIKKFPKTSIGKIKKNDLLDIYKKNMVN
jgi:acyl-CoA synthetase (AMP-forming)/AMP-acid ligase II